MASLDCGPRAAQRGLSKWTLAVSVFLLGALTPVLAQERPLGIRDEATTFQGSQASPPAPDSDRLLTGKERLGEKWTDEQRVNNCKVPANRRGKKPRPDTCANKAAD